jgi:mono/diheme cytochrome c family protein
MKFTKNIYLVAVIGASFSLVSCGASGDNPGTEYAPQMYHSVAYEPLSQIRDKEIGGWLSTGEGEEAEFYNSNPNNPHGMTMRMPAPNTVARNKDGFLPYRYERDEIERSQNIENPIELTDQVIGQGRQLYTQYCSTCHGDGGEGDGLAGQVVGGVANLKGGAYIDLSEGHIFHVITHGKGRMLPHGSQMSIERRWQIVHYVKQEIQKQ